MIYSRFNHPLFFVKIFCRILLKKICQAIYGQPREQIEGWWLMFILKPETAMGRLNQQELEIQWVYMCTIYIYSPCLPGLVVAHGKHGKNRYQVVVMVILVGLVVMFWKLGITTNYRYMIYIYISYNVAPPSFKMFYKPHECYSFKMLICYLRIINHS